MIENFNVIFKEKQETKEISTVFCRKLSRPFQSSKVFLTKKARIIHFMREKGLNIIIRDFLAIRAIDSDLKTSFNL